MGRNYQEPRKSFGHRQRAQRGETGAGINISDYDQGRGQGIKSLVWFVISVPSRDTYVEIIVPLAFII